MVFDRYQELSAPANPPGAADFESRVASLRDHHDRVAQNRGDSIAGGPVAHRTRERHAAKTEDRTHADHDSAQPGILTKEGERTVFHRVADALLEAHGRAENPLMRDNVIGRVEVFPEGASHAAGKARSLAVVEVKVPSVTFATPEVRERFVRRVEPISSTS